MKEISKYIIAAMAMLLGCMAALAQSPTTSQNYVMETVVKVPGKTTPAMLNGLPVGQANRTIQYFDGLGRPLQTVQWQGSPNGRDVVQVFEYDALGREAKKYLPYAEQSAGDGSYKPSGIATQGSFYQVGGGWDGASVKTPSPFSITQFEPSPLNRVSAQGFPGAAWQPSATPGTDHTVRMSYGTNNTDATNNATTGFAVRLFRAEVASGTGNEHKRTLTNATAYYGAGQLYLSISRDENWQSSHGKAGTVEEYKDKEGRIVLKRTFNEKGGIEVLSTYYVYDDFGNLSFVLPPGASPDAGMPGGSLIDDFCYQYRYDGRRRLIEKRIPGKDDWEHMVYNKLDQLVASQDANLRAANQWQFTKYDALGRTVMTGIFTKGSNNTRAQVQGEVDADSDGTAPDYPLWETRPAGSDYTDVAYPRYSELAYARHTVAYYDSYDFPGAATTQYQYAGRSVMTRGLATGSLVNVLGTSDHLLGITYYDDHGRIRKTFGQHHKGGAVHADSYDEVTNVWEFDGTLSSTERIHHVNGSTTTRITDSYTYDHMGRKKTTSQKIDTSPDGPGPIMGATVQLSEQFYNEVGLSSGKKLHNGMQATSYTYNERGWLTGIKAKVIATNADILNITLDYNSGSYPQYNGNISSQGFMNSDLGTTNSFTYRYDGLNRLTIATAANNSLGETISYDLMGNIHTLDREGHGPSTYDSYTGNRLMGITGAYAGSFSYDANGNVKTDSRRLITDIGYNHLNLPQTVTGPVNLSFTYDAGGRKLRKVGASGTVDYVDGIQYKPDGTIDFIQTGEGIARNSGGTYSYEYNLTDHLGNVRTTFRENPNPPYGIEVIQRDDYYAFGLRKSPVVKPGTNSYLYNGKELQDELEQYDYGARFYDPEIGRWNVIDPLAEKMRRHSPYNYAFNNPIRFIDPDGMEGTDWVKKGNKWMWDENITTAEQAKTAGYDDYRAPGSIIDNASVGEQKAVGRVLLGDNGQASYVPTQNIIVTGLQKFEKWFAENRGGWTMSNNLNTTRADLDNDSKPTAKNMESLGDISMFLNMAGMASKKPFLDKPFFNMQNPLDQAEALDALTGTPFTLLEMNNKKSLKPDTLVPRKYVDPVRRDTITEAEAIRRQFKRFGNENWSGFTHLSGYEWRY